MRIYVKCPCCGRTIFLVMEMELGSNYGLNYKQQPSNDWNCLNNWLECLQNSQGERVYLGVSEKEERKFPNEEIKELIMNWTEKGYQKPVEEKKPQESKPLITYSEPSDDVWTQAGFTPQQKKDWINAGLSEEDVVFATWLRDKKGMSAERALNYGNMQELKDEYWKGHYEFD